MSAENKKVIVLTGFGPFGCYKKNPSWDVAKTFDGFENNDYKIKALEIPVSYKYVDQNLHKIWDTYNPFFVIHVGVNGYSNIINLEQIGNRTGYVKPDIDGICPPGGTCSTDFSQCVCKNDQIINKLKLNDILNEFDEKFKNKICISLNAGKYLCEYIYYKSLSISNGRALFVHIPDIYCQENELDENNSVSKPVIDFENCREIISKIIELVYKQLSNN